MFIKHTKFQIGINICHVTFLQCAWIKLDSSSLANVENVTSNFGRSLRIYCREKEKIIAIAFAYTQMHKKQIYWNN